jgi:hypothetical protein
LRRVVKAAPWLCVVLLSSTLLGGCAGSGTHPSTSTTTSSAPPKNGCTPFPRPGAPQPGAIHGQSAFEFVVGLVCDYIGGVAVERARVPGTPGHDAAKEFLVQKLRATGWTTFQRNFTGSQYESVMLKGGSSSYSSYYADCDRALLPRMRGLNFTNIEARAGTIGGPIFLMMAHWESKWHANQDPVEANRTHPVLGANDGASGVGALLEFARAWGAKATPYELRILFTDGEDGFDDCHPLAGSTMYADGLAMAERNLVRSIVLLDMVGDAKAEFQKGCGSDAGLANRIWKAGADLDVRQFRTDGFCSVVDDHSPFEDRGMKAVDVIDMRSGAFPPYWHTTQDTPDKLSPDVLGGVARVLERVIAQPV